MLCQVALSFSFRSASWNGATSRPLAVVRNQGVLPTLSLIVTQSCLSHSVPEAAASGEGSDTASGMPGAARTVADGVE